MLAALLSDFSDADALSPQRMSKRLRLPIADFARLAHLHRNTLARGKSAAIQKKLEPIARLLAQVEEIAGNPDQAILWFRYQPVPGFGGQTAQQLVENGHVDAVFGYLEELRDGGYA